MLLAIAIEESKKQKAKTPLLKLEDDVSLIHIFIFNP